MDTNRPRPRTSPAFEYFLYAAIIVETALAAFVYKIIFGDPDLARLSLYFAIFYFAFLAWCIAQLNSLHRRRKLAPAEPIEPGEPSTEAGTETTPGPVSDPAPTEKPRHSTFGLTTSQLVVVIVVFVSAVATFSWALKQLP
jgi:hypothetical protein